MQVLKIKNWGKGLFFIKKQAKMIKIRTKTGKIMKIKKARLVGTDRDNNFRYYPFSV